MDDAIDTEWLRAAFRFSLRATEYAASIDGGDKGPPQQRDPRFRKLVEGILHSKKLILTYHVVIVGVVALVAAIHYTERLLQWRRRRALRCLALSEVDAYDGDAVVTKSVTVATRETEAGSSSSGSSTLGGAESPAREAAKEDTPLLHEGHALRPLYPRSSLLSSFKAFLMYQPRPIPVVNKTLPTNGTTIVILAFIGLNIFYTLFHINFNLFELFVLADRCGLVFVANLPLLYIFAAKTQPLRLLTGYSYESLNIFHRRLGELICFEALLHAIGMFATWAVLLRPSGSS